MRVIVTGGRHWGEGRGDNGDAACKLTLAAVLEPLRPAVIVQGGCLTGADMLARWWAKDRGVVSETFSADWGSYGPSAGPRRNTAMIEGGADVVVAFPGGRGTADCVRKARAAGIPVLVVVPNDAEVLRPKPNKPKNAG
jgi:hypothetical protein